MLCLGIETATDVCGVALMCDGRLLGEVQIREPRSHAAHLVPLIQQLLQSTGVRAADIDLVAISAGPGSYTGLRIGASTAKGLCFAMGAALVAVPSLEAVASLAPNQPPLPVLVVFPSRRGEVYAAIYERWATDLRAVLPPTAIELAALEEYVPAGPLYLMGPASSVVLQALPEPARLRPLLDEPSAVAIATLGLQRFARNDVEEVAGWEPDYLKAFIAKPPRPIFE